jgi:hypothetical protein
MGNHDEANDEGFFNRHLERAHLGKVASRSYVPEAV